MRVATFAISVLASLAAQAAAQEVGYRNHGHAVLDDLAPDGNSHICASKAGHIFCFIGGSPKSRLHACCAASSTTKRV
jgi:hypothetical protein